MPAERALKEAIRCKNLHNGYTVEKSLLTDDSEPVLSDSVADAVQGGLQAARL